MEHTGRAVARSTTWGGVLVLCPAGHVVTAARPGEWAGSDLEARVAFGWVVTCHGAVSGPFPDATNPNYRRRPTVKTWADLSPEDEKQVRQYLAEDPNGRRIVEYLAKEGQEPAELVEGDRDFALWLIVVDRRCRTLGVSFLDLADFTWRLAFDDELHPGEALKLALAGEGLV